MRKLDPVTVDDGQPRSLRRDADDLQVALTLDVLEGLPLHVSHEARSFWIATLSRVCPRDRQAVLGHA